MKNILLVGGSGFIGKILADHFIHSGYSVSILSRNPSEISGCKTFTWNPGKGILAPEIINGQDIIVNLAGAGLVNKLWTKKRKNTLYYSRIKSTQLLVDTILQHKLTPELFINASAIGYYGDRPGEKLSEFSDPGKGFLSTVCIDWEKEVRRLENSTIKYAILRIGIVLSLKGGSFPKFLLPIKMRLNVLFGSGNQHLSWIHIDDLISIVSDIASKILKPGIYNCVSPEPVRQKEFNKAMIKNKKVRALQIKLPQKILRLFLGELSELFLSDQNISPENLLKQNFQFSCPEINACIEHLIKKSNP